MEGRIISNNIVNINILFLMDVIEIMIFFKIHLIGKTSFAFTSFTLGLKRPVHRGFGCKR